MTVATNLGSGGAALDAQYGSASDPNSNEPSLLSYEGTPYLWLPGSFPNTASTPDSAPLQITGDIDITVRILPSAWEPASPMTIVAKWFFAQLSYRLYLSTAGLTLETASAGTIVAASTSLSFLTGVTQPLWFRATRDVNNGSGGNTTVFYWAADDSPIEPSDWTELQTVINTGTTSISAFPIAVEMGADGLFGFNMYSGRLYRVILRSGINGTVVLDSDFSLLSSGAQQQIVEQSPNAAIVTISRATSGRKSAAVVEPIWSLGADDFFQIEPSPLLDLGAADSATILSVARPWGTQAAGAALADNASGLGSFDPAWALRNSAAAPLEAEAHLADGSSEANASAPARSAGALSASWAIRDRAAGSLVALDGSLAGSAAADPTGSLAAGSRTRIGASSVDPASAFLDAEIRAVAVWRRALSAEEIGAIVEYYGV